MTLCTVSGLQPRSYCPTREELLLPGQEPEALCDVHVARPRRHRDRDDDGGSWLVRKLRKIFGDG